MRVLLASLAILASLTVVADAGYTCRKVLNSVVCSYDGGGSTTCRRILNTIRCS